MGYCGQEGEKSIIVFYSTEKENCQHCLLMMVVLVFPTLLLPLSILMKLAEMDNKVT